MTYNKNVSISVHIWHIDGISIRVHDCITTWGAAIVFTHIYKYHMTFNNKKTVCVQVKGVYNIQ